MTGKRTIRSEKADYFDRNPDLTLYTLLSFFGFLAFMQNPTAYKWGEQDMMPFLERLHFSEYLPADFFTNASMIANPRWIFGYFITAWSWILQAPWYDAMFVGKLLLSIALPVLHYRVIRLLIGRYLPLETLKIWTPIVALLVILMVFVPGYRYYFSVGDWISYNAVINASNLCLLFCFLGIIFREKQYRPLIYMPLFVFGFLMHPAMGMFCVIFYVIFLLPELKKEYKSITGILILGVISTAALKIFFGGPSTLSSIEFVEYYAIERHPWHYNVPEFRHKLGNWKYFFFFMNILFLIPTVINLMRKRWNLFVVALVAWGCYASSIGAQFFFTNLYPLKFFAYLGPSRFTIFGYWMLLIVWIVTFAKMISLPRKMVIPSIGVKNYLLIITTLTLVGLLYLDDPWIPRSSDKNAFYEFVKTTPKKSIFLSHSLNLNTDLRIIGRRGVFASMEFPFVESKIKEYTDRYIMAYGSKRNSLSGVKFYRSLDSKDFAAMSEEYQLDYFIIENEYSGKFDHIRPVWKGNRTSIYAIKDLKEIK